MLQIMQIIPLPPGNMIRIIQIRILSALNGRSRPSMVGIDFFVGCVQCSFGSDVIFFVFNIPIGA